MQSIIEMASRVKPATRISLWLCLCLCCLSPPLTALESDRQQPLEVNANSTDGTLGDGITTLRGDVDIRQGTLHITADEAEVNKVDGRVNSVTFRGEPAFLEHTLRFLAELRGVPPEVLEAETTSNAARLFALSR